MVQKGSPATFYIVYKLIHSVIGIINCRRNFYIAVSSLKLTLIRATGLGNIDLSRIFHNLHSNSWRNSIILRLAHIGEKVLSRDNAIAHRGAC